MLKSIFMALVLASVVTLASYHVLTERQRALYQSETVPEAREEISPVEVCAMAFSLLPKWIAGPPNGHLMICGVDVTWV